MTSTRKEAPRTIRVRKLDFPFADADIPRAWLHGNPLLSNIANGLNLLFPPGEQFFIRSVKHYVDRVDDLSLRSRVKAFFGQEGRHGHEHEHYNRVLERQGYEIQRFLRVYERVAFGLIEPRVPAILRLSTTVALEHFTASLAEGALKTVFLDGAHPLVAQLLRWHAAEEIEHKSVAFDVLTAVDPRYSLRIAGLVIATSQLALWWFLASAALMSQEKLSLAERAHWRAAARRVLRENEGPDRLELFRRAILDYLRPGFHPDDRDDYALARDYLASIEAAA